jgi:hypothetical protein
MATPIHRGNEELPSNKVSHKCTILLRGNTSEIFQIKNLDTYYRYQNKLQCFIRFFQVLWSFYNNQLTCLKA